MIDLLTARIRDVPDFPKPGIVFKDLIWSLLVRDLRRLAVTSATVEATT